MTRDHLVRIGLVLLVAVLPRSAAGDGGSVATIDPFKDVTAVNLEIVVGEPIRIDDPHARPLFGIDHDRQETFKKTLRSRLAARLGDSGIEVSELSRDHLLFAFFGGSSERSDCQGKGVFLIEVTLTTRDQKNEPLEQYSREVLGVVQTNEPEEALSAAATRVLEDVLSKRP